MALFKITPAFVRPNEIKRLVGNNKKLHSVIGIQSHSHIKETLRWMYEEGLSKMIDLSEAKERQSPV